MKKWKKALMLEAVYHDASLKKYIKIESHIKRVSSLCKKLSKKFISAGIYVDWKLLKKAAKFHDIAKFKNPKEHQKRNAVEPHLRPLIKKRKELNAVVMIIGQHRKDFSPSSYVVESAILRLCDNIDKFNKALNKKKTKKILEEKEKGLEALEKSFNYFRNEKYCKDFKKKGLRILETFARKQSSELNNKIWNKILG